MSNYQKLIAGTTNLVAPTDNSVVNNPIILSCNSTAGAITINLPSIASLNAAACLGVKYIINDQAGTAGTNNITVVPDAADKANNAASLVINQANGTLEVSVSDLNDWLGESSTGGTPSVARTATAAGLTTGTIANGNVFVNVTSDDANKIIVLPAPVPGTRVLLLNGATGYELRSNAPATVAINGGVGAAAESAIGASTYVEMVCVSATAWIGRQYDTAGVQSAVEVAAP